MSSDDRFAFVLAAVLSGAVLLGLSQMRKPVVGGLADAPRAGRADTDVPFGPSTGPGDDAEWEPDADEIRGEERVRGLLSSRDFPPFARLVVFHPFAGQEPDGASLEQGPPFHVVVAEDGSLRWTGRGEAGAPSQPPGIPAHVAIRALHVALPAAADTRPARLGSVRALWREAARRFGARAALFADEVPESTAHLPEGFDRTSWIAPQESRNAATRGRAPASKATSRPARIAIGFGSTTILAPIASTFDVRGAGLMGRRSLDANEGLLFVYRSPDSRSFWMKGCLIPLDIIYLKDDGEVLSVATAPPADPKASDADLPRYQSPAPCRLALEVAGGQAARAGVRQGSKLLLPESVAREFEKADP
jgi:uncharacterized protein